MKRASAMWYYRRLPDGLVVMHTRPEHASQLEELQRICFPTLDPNERFKAAHYRKHLELFPDGQFVALEATAWPVRRRRLVCLANSTTSTNPSPDSSKAACRRPLNRRASGSTAAASAAP